MFRKADVECRTSTCDVMLVHTASNGSEGSVADLVASLRQALGFVTTRTDVKQIPLQFTDDSEPTRRVIRTIFASGYHEIVLMGGTNAHAQAREAAH